MVGGVFETVEELIEALKKCDPKAKVFVKGGLISVVHFSNEQVYLDVIKQG